MPPSGRKYSQQPLATEVKDSDQLLVLDLTEVDPVKRNKRTPVSLLKEYIGAVDGEGAVFPDDEPPVATAVGNLPAGYALAGESIVEVLRQAFSLPYQVPQFNDSLRVQGASDQTLEVGAPFGAGFKSVTWSISNGGNVVPNSVSFQDVTAGTTLASNEPNDGTLSASTAAFTVGLGESRRYRISAQNTQGGTLTDDVVISGLYASYFGYSTAGSLSATQVVGLGNPQLQGGKGRTVSNVTASGGAYTYYAYPAQYGDLSSIILDGAAPVLGSFQKLADIQVTNAQGAQVLMRVYRSNATNAFTSNTLAFN